MKIAYGKLGRSFSLAQEKLSSVGGDIEVFTLLNHLRKDHEVHLVGPNRHDAKLENCVQYWDEEGVFNGLPIVGDKNRSPDDPVYTKFMRHLENVQLPKFDAWVIWLGQHGTSSSFIPKVMAGKEGNTTPLMSLINYVYPLVHMINKSGAKPIWLCPDPRNKLKARDLWEPRQDPVLAQYDTTRDNSFYSPEHGLRDGLVEYAYAGIEMLAVDPTSLDEDRFNASLRHDRPQAFGILVNEGYANIGKWARLHLIQEWFKGLDDWEIFGNWCPASQRALNRRITTVPVGDVTKTMQRWRSTITFPATGTGWATAKPWECFAAGTICFRHPKYDDQEHIYGKHMNSELYSFLSLTSPEQLRDRVKKLQNDTALWKSMAERQFKYLMQSAYRLDGGAIEVKRQLGKDMTA